MKTVLLLCALLIIAAPGWSQSRDQNFPTPIRTNEINAQIAARDVGDARLTQHFYVFDAENGDLNLNVETNNFNGDFDLFEANTLRPLGKVTVFADVSPTKSKRVFYFRKRERVILRVEGRTLSDEPAFYRINFSGGFLAVTDFPDNSSAEIETPKITAQSSTAVARVNSAGAIIEVLPPAKTGETEDNKTPEKKVVIIEPKTSNKPIAAVKKPSAAKPPASNATVKPKPNQPKKPNLNQGTTSETTAKSESATTATNARRTSRRPAVPRRKPTRTENSSETVENGQPDPLVNIRLVVTLKNKTKYERPMTEIMHLNVDKEQITVVTKYGEIKRFDLLKVEKMTIEQN